MKKIKLFLLTFTVLAIIAATLAFKTSALFSQKAVFCNSTCPASSAIAFRIDPNGSISAPCGAGVQPYALGICSGTYACSATVTGTTFSATDAGN